MPVHLLINCLHLSEGHIPFQLLEGTDRIRDLVGCQEHIEDSLKPIRLSAVIFFNIDEEFIDQSRRYADLPVVNDPEYLPEFQNDLIFHMSELAIVQLLPVQELIKPYFICALVL